MITIHPFVYKYLCTTTSNLVTLPLDIAQTKILSDREKIFSFEEFKWLLLFPIIFTSQSVVYDNLQNIKNIFLRGGITGLITSPVYIFFETKKLYSRTKCYPDYFIYSKWIIIRQIIFYSLLYKIFISNIMYPKIVSPFISNTIGFPIKLIALTRGYEIFNIDRKRFKLSALTEIFKSSINDGLSLYLIYNSNFSPI